MFRLRHLALRLDLGGCHIVNSMTLHHELHMVQLCRLVVLRRYLELVDHSMGLRVSCNFRYLRGIALASAVIKHLIRCQVRLGPALFNTSFLAAELLSLSLRPNTLLHI